MKTLFVLAEKLDAKLFSAVAEFDGAVEITAEAAATMIHSEAFDLIHWQSEAVGIRHFLMIADGRPISSSMVRPDIEPESVNVGDVALVFMPKHPGVDLANAKNANVESIKIVMFIVNKMEATSGID